MTSLNPQIMCTFIGKELEDMEKGDCPVQVRFEVIDILVESDERNQSEGGMSQINRRNELKFI